MTDQQKRDSLSVYGNPVCLTPHLERLASEGVTFDYAFTPYPVCVPSRVMTFTGRYSHVNRSRANSVWMQPGQDHLVKRLSDAGYTTALSGKNHCFQPDDLALFDSVWECGHGGPSEPSDENVSSFRQTHGVSGLGGRICSLMRPPEMAPPWARARWFQTSPELPRSFTANRSFCGEV